MAANLSPWPGSTSTSARNYLAAVFEESATDNDWWTRAAAKGEAAAALVEAFAPGAPDPVKTESVVRVMAYLFDSPGANIQSETLGPMSQSYAVGQLSALRHSGSLALLSPWKVRRAV